MMRLALIVPFFNHEHAIRQTVAALKVHGYECWLVDDGSDARCAPVLDDLAANEAGWLRLIRNPVNRGKGIAVLAGFKAAHAAGCTHALQIDADGQHDFAAIPRMATLAQESPTAVVTGVPVFDASAPASRRIGRKFTTLWVRINTLSTRIEDAMCGFRVYPLAPILDLAKHASFGSRMEFDPEILVRAVWAGMPVVSMPTYVVYPTDGVSHFKMWRDNVRISWMHTRLFFGMLRRLPMLLARNIRS
ncbi:MAG: glycosyltransferase family 2 protein [Pseudomonadota bacterium]